jgi:hypothetical protein
MTRSYGKRSPPSTIEANSRYHGESESLKTLNKTDPIELYHTKQTSLELNVCSSISESNHGTSLLPFHSKARGPMPVPYEKDEIFVSEYDKTIIFNYSSSKWQSSVIIKAERPLPLGRPLPPAPRFPKVSPGTAHIP